MWSSKKYAAMAIAGFGLAAAMATPASAWWPGYYGAAYGSVGCGSYYGAVADITSVGCGDYGYAGGYGFAGSYGYPAYGYAGTYGGAYGYATPTYSYGWPYAVNYGSDLGYSGAYGYAGYGYGAGYGYAPSYGYGYGCGRQHHHRPQGYGYVTASRQSGVLVAHVPVRSRIAAVRRHDVAQKASRQNFALAD